MRVWVNAGLRAGEGARSTWFHKFCQDRPPGFKLVFQAQHRQGNGARLRTSKADDANPATTRRSGDGDDGVIQIHREIVAGEGFFLAAYLRLSPR